MALGGKTVQYTLAVDMETGQLTAESRRVAAELNLIKRQTVDTDLTMRELSGGIKGVKQALSLISGAAVFGLITSSMSQLVDFAQTYSTKTSEAADNLERIGKTLKTQIADSSLFQGTLKVLEGIGLALLAGPGRGPKYMDQRRAALANVQTEKEIKAAEEIKKLTEEIANAEKAVNAIKRDGIKLDTELRDLAWERSRMFKDEILADTEPLMDVNFQMAEAAMIAHDEILVSQKDSLLNSLEALDAAYEDNSQSFREKEIEAHQAWASEMNAISQGFFVALAEGFAAVGAATVNGKNALASFGAVFLKSIAQLAVQFGTFLVLYGTGMNFIPGGQAFSAGAIAAGVALTVFGGALGALANKIGGSSSSRAEEREQRFRDSRFGTSGGGGTTINNYINFQNAIGLNDSGRKEVAEVVSQEMFKQIKLGRISAIPA